MIPEGWVQTTIGDVDVLTEFAFKSDDYTSEASHIRLLRGDNVAQHKLRWRDSKRLPPAKEAGLERYRLKLGDFVIALDRTWIPAGVKLAEIKDEDLPCLLVQRVARLRSKPGLHQNLLRQYFSGDHFANYVKSVQTETAVPHISPNDIRDYPIILPPLPEQRRIAEILSTWDRAVETVELLIANAHDLRAALTQHILAGNRRLAGFADPWRRTKLGNICDPKQWTTITSKDMTSEGVPVFGVNSYIGRFGVPNHIEDTLVIFCRGSCGEVHIVPGPSYITGNAMCLDGLGKNGHQLNVVAELIRRQGTQSMISGSAQPQIIRSAVLNFEILLPSKTEQKELGAIIAVAEGAIQKLEAQLARLRREKSALMQKLLTGKRRVKLDRTSTA